MANVEVHIPIAESRLQSYPLAPRLDVFGDVKLGWLDNMKANAGELLSILAERAQAHASGQLSAITESKNATAPAPEAVMSHLKACDAVVLAIAD